MKSLFTVTLIFSAAIFFYDVLVYFLFINFPYDSCVCHMYLKYITILLPLPKLWYWTQTVLVTKVKKDIDRYLPTAFITFIIMYKFPALKHTFEVR